MDCHLMVGDKVVCVKTPKSPGLYGCQGPVAGVIYTVRQIVPRKFLNGSPGVGVLLQEIINPEWHTPDGVMEPAFLHTWFRRMVDTTETVAEMAAIVRREFEPTPSKKEAVK